MKKIYTPGLLLCALATVGCIRLAGTKSDEKTELPSGDPVVAPQSSSSDAPKEGTFKVKFETTAGDFVVLAHRDWAPIGAERFHELVTSGFFEECRFFRNVPGFIVQFGLNGDPEIQSKWRVQNLQDEPVKVSNKRGTLCFAKAGPNTRTTQLFVNYGDNTNSLDPQGFSVFAEVIEGMENVDKIEAKYGERPDQGQIQMSGNAYLKQSFPDLDYIKKATIIEEGGESSGDKPTGEEIEES